MSFRCGGGGFGLRRWRIGCGGVAGSEWEKKEERGEDSLLHGEEHSRELDGYGRGFWTR